MAAAPVAAVPTSPLDSKLRVVDDTAQSALTWAEQQLAGRQRELLAAFGTGDNLPVTEELLAVLGQRVAVVGAREEVHAALVELTAELRKGLDADAGELAAWALYHVYTRPDAIAVAFVCTLAQDLARELVGIVVALEEAIAWGIAVELALDMPLAPWTVDEMLELVEQHPDELGWARDPLQRARVLQDAAGDFARGLVQLVDDPAGSLLGATSFMTATIRVASRYIHDDRGDVAADLREIKGQPLALGELLGHAATFVMLAALGAVVGEVELAAIAAKLPRAAVAEAKALSELLGVTDKLYTPKLLTFARLRKRIADTRKYHQGYRAVGELLKLLGKLKVSAERADELAELAAEIVMKEFGKLNRKVGVVEDLAAGNAPFNDRALIGTALMARSGGLETPLSKWDDLILTGNLREVWLEAMHIVDARLWPLYRDDFTAVLQWTTPQRMPGVNGPSEQHTESLRRFLQRLLRAKTGSKIKVSPEDLAADTASITRVFVDAIWIKGSRAAAKPGAFIVDPKTTRPSELLTVIRGLWQAEPKGFKLPPEGFAVLDDAIAKLKAKGR